MNLRFFAYVALGVICSAILIRSALVCWWLGDLLYGFVHTGSLTQGACCTLVVAADQSAPHAREAAYLRPAQLRPGRVFRFSGRIRSLPLYAADRPSSGSRSRQRR
jgi:hypothetical protein